MSLFKVKQANDWIRGARSKPTPRKLFGDFWLEGELSMLFAAAGIGKSLLAVQIAESIARGTAIEPAKLEAGKQKVLYIDCDLSDKQFEMRYAKESGKGLVAHHRFSANFIRAEIQIGTEKPEDAASFEDFVADSIAELIRETGSRVIIIDDITRLCGGSERSSDAVRMMRALRKMKFEMGISLLVLAQTPKRRSSSSLAVSDLQSTRVLAGFADNVFAIGQSRRDPAERYIKHIRPRSTELIHDESHVVGLKLARSGGFLGFSFTGFAPEHYHVADNGERARLARAIEIHQLYRDGLSQREIAVKLDISLGSVNRYLQMEVPDLTREIEHRPADVGPIVDEPIEFNSLTMEERRAEYLKDAGTADVVATPPGLRRGGDASSAGWSGPTGWWERRGGSSTALGERDESPSADAHPRFSDPHLAKFEHRIDHMGDDIWIEEERFGKPWIYYKVNKNNVKFRYERTNTSAIFTTLVKDEPP